MAWHSRRNIPRTAACVHREVAAGVKSRARGWPLGGLVLLVGLTAPPAQSQQRRNAAPACADAAAVPHYDLRVRQDSAGRRLDVDGSVRLPARLTRTSALTFRLRPEMDSLSVEVVAPVASAGPARATRRDVPGQTPEWVVTPPNGIPAGAAIEVRLRYRSVKPTGLLYHLGTDVTFERATWYTKVEDGLATGTLRFEMPAGMTVVATGTRRNGDAVVFDVVRPSEFAFTVARYHETRLGEGSPVAMFQLRERSQTDTLARRLTGINAALVREFGAAPVGQLTVAEVPSSAAGPAGFDGASMDGFLLVTESYLDTPPRDFNLGYFAHELAHQWWGNA